MGDDAAGRARRKELELLQGRLKEAQEDLEVAHGEGYVEELDRLREETIHCDAAAALLEREGRDKARQLAAYRHDVEEAERQLLAPKTVSSVGPATAAIAFASVLASVVALSTLLTRAPTMIEYVVVGVLAVVPPPVFAWVWRRRLSGTRK